MSVYIDQVSRALLRVTEPRDGFALTQRFVISEIFQALVSIVPRIDSLVARVDLAMSDALTIQSVYIAIGPFFVAEPVAEGKNAKDSVALTTFGGPTALRGLRLSALSLVRSVCGCSSNHVVSIHRTV
jgi:cohesin loading factor subunit SCC2